MALDTITDLLATVERLPADERRRARGRVAAAVELPAPAAHAALGLLALDLAPVAVPQPTVARQAPELVIDLAEAGAVAPRVARGSAAAAPSRT